MAMVRAALGLTTYGKEKNLIEPMHGVVPLSPIKTDVKEENEFYI